MTETIKHLIHPDGTQEWVLNGKRHRVDGPALVRADGMQQWWVYGLCHRFDGPAVVYKDGTQIWAMNNLLHRIDGPAIIPNDGSHEWWVNDQNKTQQIKDWMELQGVDWPWDELTQMQFAFIFG
jgi:hypothetical protein